MATRKHPSFQGWRMAICQPIARDGRPEGPPQVAVDPLGAAVHETVIISSDGYATRRLLGDARSPARWLVIGIIDDIEPSDETTHGRTDDRPVGQSGDRRAR